MQPLANSKWSETGKRKELPMKKYPLVQELIRKAPTKGSEAVGPERRAFLPGSCVPFALIPFEPTAATIRR